MVDLTVVVPTYNRPVNLARLVAYMRASAPVVRLVVLDSSRDDAALRNAASCAAVGAVRKHYPDDTPFYDKVCDGVASLVSTSMVCLCADDDLVVPDALAVAADTLRDDSAVAVAHGYYAQFTLVGGGRVTGFSGGGREFLDDDPLRRVAEGLLDYEATVYAVQRTDGLLDGLREAAAAPSLLAAELISTLLSLARGKTRRVPLFTHARSIAPSISYRHYHPAESIATDPAALIRSIAFVRDRLAAHLPAPQASDLRLFDFAVMAYLADHVRPMTARRLARMALDGRSADEMREAGLADFAMQVQPDAIGAALRGSAPARWLARELARHEILRERVLRVFRNRGRRSREVSVSLAGQRRVGIKFEQGFVRALAGVSCSFGDVATLRFAKAMALYVTAVPPVSPAPRGTSMYHVCNVCGGTLVDIPEFRRLPRVTSDCKPFDAGGALSRCVVCGSMQKQVTPALGAELGRIYAGYDVYHQAGGMEQMVNDVVSGAPARRSSVLSSRLVSTGLLPRRGRAIDVGCGNGAFLAALSGRLEVWRFSGLELDDRHAKELAGIPGFEQLEIGRADDIAGRYDLISMVHALEHFTSPLDTLAILRAHLEDSGLLFVQVPNVAMNPFDLLIADHVSHFTPWSLRALLARAGFETVYLATDWVSKELSVLARGAADVPAPTRASDTVSDRPIAWLSDTFAAARAASERRPFGLFGTSVAATWFAGSLGERIDFYVDEDPSRLGRSFFGKPVLPPSETPAGARVFVGLAPAIARVVGDRLQSRGIDVLLPPPLP